MSKRRRPGAARGPRADVSEPRRGAARAPRADVSEPRPGTARAPHADVSEPPAGTGEPAPRPARPSPSWEPAAIPALLVAACGVLVSVSYRISEYDIWQHLLVGKAIWQAHAVPMTHLWSWPTYGAPEVLPAWGFRALLWPFWSVGGVTGLFAWRWLVALATFGILWAAARRAGARGLSALAVLVFASLTYRIHARLGPETLAALLLAVQIWILEMRRDRFARAGAASGLDPAVWLVPVAWVWANVHDTYWLGLVVIAVHLLEAALAAMRSRASRPPQPVARLAPGGPRRLVPAAGSARLLLWVALAAVAISFLNPFGWRSLWEPFGSLLHGRGEAALRGLTEHQSIVWSTHWRSGLPLLVLGWPALILWRAVRSRMEWAEAFTCAALLGLAFYAQRFAAFTVVGAAPYVARDLDAWIRTRRWPAWTARGLAPAALASAACVVVGLLEWSRPEYPIAVAIEMDRYPVKACDFIGSHGIQGRGFMPSSLGGYVLWRFWPDRERLPFMDTPRTGTRADRELYAFAFSNSESWQELDRRYSFDYALLDGHGESGPGDRLLDFLDADSTWALVFRDDAAALYVRREGPLAAVAESSAFFFVPGGEARIPLLVRAGQMDTVVRRMTERELGRQIEESPGNSRAHSLLATLAWIGGRPAEAREHLQAALARDPRTPGAHQRLGLMALAHGKSEEAVREFREELKLGQPSGDLSLFLGRSYQRLGDFGQARAWYRRGVRLDPANAAARESLEVLDSGARGR
jgi:hypothetical protein